MTERFYTTNRDIERARELCKTGVLLADRTEGFHRLELYQLPDSYLEVTWHIHFNVVTKVSRFDGTERLEPYLNQISLDGLI